MTERAHDGSTALMLAAEGGHKDCVVELLLQCMSPKVHSDIVAKLLPSLVPYEYDHPSLTTIFVEIWLSPLQALSE